MDNAEAGRHYLHDMTWHNMAWHSAEYSSRWPHVDLVIADGIDVVTVVDCDVDREVEKLFSVLLLVVPHYLFPIVIPSICCCSFDGMRSKTARFATACRWF